MRHLTRLAVAVCLLCGAIVSAQNSSTANDTAAASASEEGVSKAETPTFRCNFKDPICSNPQALYSPPPEYSERARKARYQGACVLSLLVGTDGRPKDIHVMSSLGMGLDEKAIQAVKKWRFKPAMRDGKPVPAQIAVYVDFHLD